MSTGLKEVREWRILLADGTANESGPDSRSVPSILKAQQGKREASER